MTLATFWARYAGRFQREASARLVRRPFRMQNTAPLISFTFDDFPRSALHTAGKVLEEHGIQGTYYTSMGLMGTIAPTGEIFHREDLPCLLESGHEVGCHTYSHCHSWDTPPAEFEENIKRNTLAMREVGITARMESLSYPISGPRPGTKRRASKHFAGCRAGGQTFNREEIDLDHLQAFFLEQCRDRPEAILAMIDATIAANGWLIFATHDVCASPTRYGCTPALFRSVVSHSIASGARIVPVSVAMREIGVLPNA